MEIVEVTRTTELDAPIRDVWDAITDSAALSHWLADEVDIDVRPGGVGRMRFTDGDKSVLVTEVDANRRLSLLWWGDDGETSSVELTLTESPCGTRLEVVERLGTPVAQAGTGTPTSWPEAQARSWGTALTRLPGAWCRV